MARKQTAGDKLRAQMDAYLASHGAGWAWDESELAALHVACESATRAEKLNVLLDAELSSDSPRATSVTRTSGCES